MAPAQAGNGALRSLLLVVSVWASALVCPRSFSAPRAQIQFVPVSCVPWIMLLLLYHIVRACRCTLESRHTSAHIPNHTATCSHIRHISQPRNEGRYLQHETSDDAHSSTSDEGTTHKGRSTRVRQGASATHIYTKRQRGVSCRPMRRAGPGVGRCRSDWSDVHPLER